MLVTLLGIVICCKDSHPENAALPMLITLYGIVKLVFSEKHEMMEVMSAL